MALPTGLHKQGNRYVVRFKQGGRWTRKTVGTDLAAALEEHARLRGQDLGQDPPDTSATAAKAAGADPQLQRAPARVTTRRASANAPPRPPERHRPTLGECIALWMEHQRTRNKPATVKSARLRAERVLRAMGDVPVADLRTPDIDKFVTARKRGGAQAATVNCDLRILKAILRHAEACELIEKLPVRVKMLRAPRRKIVVPFTPDEIARVMAAAEPRVRALLAIAAATGLRLDEILHLQWRDIALRDCEIHVRAKTYTVRVRGSEMAELHWSPKSHQARTVSIDRHAVKELREYRAGQRWAAEHDWVFQSQRPRRRWTTPFKMIRRAFDAAGIGEIGKGTHAIRHTVATRMLQNGTDLETVRDVLGHESVTTTQVYLHTDATRRRAAAEAGSLLGD